MANLYRIREKSTGIVLGDLVIESDGAQLLSSQYEIVLTENLTSTLDDLKSFYIDEINKVTSRVRGKFITLELGQETTYIKKTIEAGNYLTASSPVDADYPYLKNEADAVGSTVADLASLVIAKSQEMDNINVVVEAQRKRGVQQVSAALTEIDAKTARDFAITSLQAH